MSAGLDGGGGREGRGLFLSAHRCPEVDLLPRHNAETQIPPCPRGSSAGNPEVTCAGQSEANYLDVSPASRREEEEEDDEGSISDWSEEDLSLHFSPSVILPSDDDEFGPESTFECVDVTMETLVKGQEGEGLKMVPKRQIQLKKKDCKVINKAKTEELKMKDGAAEGKVADGEASANEMLCPTVRHRPDLLLRQHSMPASLHAHSTTSSDVDSYRVYRGPFAGASQGFPVGGNSKQRLQKSFSLDETKTKMASCIIKSVLSKKMQAEQNNSRTSHLQKKPAVLPVPQQRVREGGGALFKAPVHVVRDMRSLVKNTYSLSFSTAPTTAPQNNKPTSIKVIGQEESPPPTYQQAVGVRGHDETRSSQAPVYSSSITGHINRVTASLSQSQPSNESNRISHPITHQRRGSEPIINRRKEDDDAIWPVVVLDPPTNSPVSHDLSELSKSERAVSHPEGTSPPPSAFIQRPRRPPSKPRHPEGTQPLLSAQEQGSILGVSSQQILHSCFYTPTALPAFPPTLPPHVGKVSYVHGPLSYIQTPLQPTLYLLRRSEESQCRLTGEASDQQDHCPPHRTRTTEDQKNGNTATSATQEQHEQQTHQQHQHQFVCSVQGFLPAKVSSDLLVDITNSAAAPGALLSDPTPPHILDPKNVQSLYVDPPPQSQRKMLLDPETGQYVQVLLPASCSTNNNTFPFPNPAPFAPSVINPAPAVLSVMQFQPTVAVSSLYAPPFLPFPLHTPAVNFTHTAL